MASRRAARRLAASVTTVTKSGAMINGDDVHIVIVRTDPGYGPQPSSTGTGTIVAVLT